MNRFHRSSYSSSGFRYPWPIALGGFAIIIVTTTVCPGGILDRNARRGPCPTGALTPLDRGWKLAAGLDSFRSMVYDNNDRGRRKYQQFHSLGLKSEVLREKPRAEKGLSATDIRHFMVNGEPCKHLVPTATITLMQPWGIPGRLRRPQAQFPSP